MEKLSKIWDRKVLWGFSLFSKHQGLDFTYISVLELELNCRFQWALRKWQEMLVFPPCFCMEPKLETLLRNILTHFFNFVFRVVSRRDKNGIASDCVVHSSKAQFILLKFLTCLNARGFLHHSPVCAWQGEGRQDSFYICKGVAFFLHLFTSLPSGRAKRARC